MKKTPGGKKGATAEARTLLNGAARQLLEAALAPLSSRELGAAVATVNRRFYAVGVRVLHRRLVEAARLPGHELILECYPPSAKVLTPYLACRHLGTRIGDGDGDGFDDARPGLADLGRLYASFRPVVEDGWPGRARVRERRGDSREASCDGDDRVYDDDDDYDDEELATQDIDLDQGEPFSQLCAVTNVKPSARQGLFLSHVNACEGVVRVWRRWLADRAAVRDDRAATGGDGVLWVDAAKNVGLRFRVAAGDAPEPAALLSGPCSDDEEPAVSYTLVYEGASPLGGGRPHLTWFLGRAARPEQQTAGGRRGAGLSLDKSRPHRPAGGVAG